MIVRASSQTDATLPGKDMPEFRVEGKNAADTVDWLRSIASLVIEEHIGAGGNASGTLAGAGPTDARGRLRAQWRMVKPCVDRLSKRQRQVVELRFREGMRYADIADRLAIPIGTVRSRLARARLVLDGLAREREKRVDGGEESPRDAGPADPAGVDSTDPAEAGPAGPVDAEDGRSEDESGA